MPHLSQVSNSKFDNHDGCYVATLIDLQYHSHNNFGMVTPLSSHLTSSQFSTVIRRASRILWCRRFAAIKELPWCAPTGQPRRPTSRPSRQGQSKHLDDDNPQVRVPTLAHALQTLCHSLRIIIFSSSIGRTDTHRSIWYCCCHVEESRHWCQR